MLFYTTTFLLGLASFAQATEVAPTGVSAGVTCTQVAAPATTSLIYDPIHSVTLSCDGSTFAVVGGKTQTITITSIATVTAVFTDMASATASSTVTSTVTMTTVQSVASAEPSEAVAIKSFTESVHSAMAAATDSPDKFLYSGRQSVQYADDGPSDESTIRRRFAEMTQVIFKNSKQFVPRILFGDLDYNEDLGDVKSSKDRVKKWKHELDRTDAKRQFLAVKESADKKQLFAQLTLWPGSNPMKVETVWNPEDKKYKSSMAAQPGQLYMHALESTLDLPHVQARLKTLGFTKKPDEMDKGEQLVMIYGMLQGVQPVFRRFEPSDKARLRATFRERNPRFYSFLLRTREDADFKDTNLKYGTYLVSETQETKDGNDMVALGLSPGRGQPEEHGLQALVPMNDLLKVMDYLVGPAPVPSGNVDCGWTGKVGNAACPWD